MIVDELKQCILESQENDCFVYAKGVPEKILKNAHFWKAQGLTVFKTLLKRIKRGDGTQDPKNFNGKIVNNLLGTKRFMAISFSPQSEEYYYIYDFKIDNLE